MKWLLGLFGFGDSTARQKKKLKQLREKAFQAQRNGNLSLAGQYLSEAEVLETQILDQQS